MLGKAVRGVGGVCTAVHDQGVTYADPFHRKRLTEVKDSAPEFGLGDAQEARFAEDDLDAEETG